MKFTLERQSFVFFKMHNIKNLICLSKPLHAFLCFSHSYSLSNYLKVAGKSGLTSTGGWWDEGSIREETVLQCVPASDFINSKVDEPFFHHQQGRIDFNTVNLSLNTQKDCTPCRKNDDDGMSVLHQNGYSLFSMWFQCSYTFIPGSDTLGREVGEEC